jgi:autophagy-related protein 9
MSSHYHRLPDIDEEADALWDQLNDEQSREVQQHQSRFRVAASVDPRHSNRTSHFVIMQSMVWTTLIRTGASASSAWQAARQAWRHHPSTQDRSRSTDLDFDEQFGINDLRPTSFSEVEEEPSNNSRSTRGGQRDERPNPGYPFVVLQQYPSRRAIERDQDRWGIVANMDVFLQNLYQYFYHRGLVPMICKFLVEFASLMFTLWLSRILLQRVDWHELATCKDEHTCKANWSDYYYDQSSSFSHRWLVQGYTALFVAYALFSVWTFWQSLQQAWKCQYIMHEKLGISRRKLEGGAVSWDTVVQQLVQAQDSGIYRTTLSRLDPLVISQRILRKENFLLAFFNQNLLDVQIGRRQYWCPTLEWSIHVCILNFMFNHKYELRPAFVLDAASLERRLIVCGIVHALLLPFLMVFLSLHFLFRNVYDFKTTKQYMGDKQWSTVAQWTFREFNELPHALERRLEPSYGAAEGYLKLFGQSEWMAALGKLLVFLGGAMGGVLLVLGVLNDAILLHVQLWGRNLLWYAGIAGIVYSVGKGLLPTKEAQPSVTKNLFADMDTALKTVSTHTHYYPEHWKGRGWDAKVHSQFGLMFDSKVKVFLWELISLVLAPYILIAKLSKCAPAICEFCMTIKAKVPGAGDVCGYSTFDFDAFKDEAWDGKTLGRSMVLPETITTPTPQQGEESLAESILRTGNLEEAARQHPKPKARDGKMEKSFFGFQAAHPSWKCNPSGQSLVDRVEEYRQAELAAMSRERDLYIDAAARQLETLVQMERDDPGTDMVEPKARFEQDRLRDFHYTRNTGGVANSTADDADAGTHPSPRLGPVPPPVSTFAPSNLNQMRMNIHPTAASPLANSSSLPFANNVDEADQGSSSLVPSPTSQSITTSNPNTDCLNHPHLHQNRTLHNPNTLSSSNVTNTTTATNTTGNRDALRAGLSTELRRLLTMSTLESGESVLATPPLVDATAAVVGTNPTMPAGTMLPDRTAERHYYWLERFHEHLESEQEVDDRRGTMALSTPMPSNLTTDVTNGDPTIARSMPVPVNTTAAADGSSSATTRHHGDEAGDKSSSSNMV